MPFRHTAFQSRFHSFRVPDHRKNSKLNRLNKELFEKEITKHLIFNLQSSSDFRNSFESHLTSINFRDHVKTTRNTIAKIEHVQSRPPPPFESPLERNGKQDGGGQRTYGEPRGLSA